MTSKKSNDKGKIMNKILCVALLASLGSTIALADNQRSAEINHTAMNYANGGVCSYAFSIDGGGYEFSDMEITMKALDTFGGLISYGTMSVDAFGDSNATRFAETYLEMECPDQDINEFEVVGVVEKLGGRKVELPLSIFHAKNPKLARVSVQATPGIDAINRNFIGTWVTDKRLCSKPEIETDSDYIVNISGNKVQIMGWQYARSETFDFLSPEDHFNTDEGFGGWVEFSQFAPDYSQTYGTAESAYRLENGYLTIDGGNLKLLSCNK